METIKKLRETMGLSKTVLAGLAGMNINSYTSTENKKYNLNPPTEIAWKIKVLSSLMDHIQTIKQLEPEILTAIENLKKEIK